MVRLITSMAIIAAILFRQAVACAFLGNYLYEEWNSEICAHGAKSKPLGVYRSPECNIERCAYGSKFILHSLYIMPLCITYSKQGGNIHLEVQYAKPIRMIRMSKSEMRMLKSAYDIKKGELHTL